MNPRAFLPDREQITKCTKYFEGKHVVASQYNEDVVDFTHLGHRLGVFRLRSMESVEYVERVILNVRQTLVDRYDRRRSRPRCIKNRSNLKMEL